MKRGTYYGAPYPRSTGRPHPDPMSDIAAPILHATASYVEIARPGTGTNRMDTPEGRLAAALMRGRG